MPEKAKALHKLLVDWRKAVRAPVPTEPNPQYDPAAPAQRPRRRKKPRGGKTSTGA